MRMMDKQKIDVGVICAEDPNDRRPQSGTTYQVFKALERQDGLNVFWIPFHDNLFSKGFLLVQKLIKRILGISLPQDRCIAYVKLKELSINKNMLNQADVVFCPFTQVVSIDKPIVYMSDAVFNQMIDYYWYDISSLVAKAGNKLQQFVLDKATHLDFPSKWIADCASEFYGQPSTKISIIELGANIDSKDVLSHEYNYDNHLHILFLGIDWERKGGDIAIEACKWLNENGVEATIHIVGTKHLSKELCNLPYVDYIGFLNKNDASQYEHFLDIISQCHCMLLPTKAECAGIAFCESSAYGLPAFSYQTGGVPNYVLNGRNGYLLPLGSSGEDFGKKIKECLITGEMERMAKEAINVYKDRLNWDVWGQRTAQIIKDIVVNNDMK